MLGAYDDVGGLHINSDITLSCTDFLLEPRIQCIQHDKEPAGYGFDVAIAMVIEWSSCRVDYSYSTPGETNELITRASYGNVCVCSNILYIQSLTFGHEIGYISL